MTRKLQNYLLNGLLALSEATVPRLSRRAVFRLARGIGYLAAILPLEARRVALANLALALPGLHRSRQQVILRESFASFALTALDQLWVSRDGRRRLEKSLVLDSSLEAVLRQGAMVCLAAHYGNWEILGHLLPLRGLSLVSVSASSGDLRLDRRVSRLRSSLGQEIVPQQGAARALLAALRRGDKIGLLLDQNTRPDEGGTFVNFFQRPVAVSLLPALLAIKTGSPVIVGFAIPQWRSLTYRVFTRVVADREQIRGLQAGDAADLSQKIMNVFEEQIRRAPEYWLWSYKRWKHVPEPYPVEQFPYYAKRYPPIAARPPIPGAS